MSDRALRDLDVLVVGDRADGARAARLLLDALGARVRVAGSGRQALRALETRAPRVVLCDLVLSDMDGLDFRARIRQQPRWARVAVVALMDRTGPADYHQTVEAGFDAHLATPVGADRLRAMLAKFEPAAAPRLPMHDFVAELLRDADPEVRLVELTKVSRHYTVRLELPGEVGKSLSFPGRFLDTALIDARSRKALRSILRSAALALRSQRSLADSREALTQTSTDPVCPACGIPIRRSSPVAVRQGALRHWECTEET